MQMITEIFCLVDDFCQEFEPLWQRMLIESQSKKRIRQQCLCLSELMSIAIMFHILRFRQFKAFYFQYLHLFMRVHFPNLPSYNRLVELMPQTIMPLVAFFQTIKGICTGISIVDSTPITVCDNLRIKRHKTFAGIAQRGKSSTGWFYGFKLHLIINNAGELLNIHLTAGNVDDRKAVPNLIQTIWGKLFADKGYLSTSLSDTLAATGIQLITKVRKNMKAKKIEPFDAAILKQRSLVETVIDELKNLCQIEHTRHRSWAGFLVNLMSGIVAYCLMPNKPTIKNLFKYAIS